MSQRLLPAAPTNVSSTETLEQVIDAVIALVDCDIQDVRMDFASSTCDLFKFPDLA